MDVQIVRYSSGSFEIVCGDMVRLADNINMNGIFEHGPIIPMSAFWFLSGCRHNHARRADHWLDKIAWGFVAGRENEFLTDKR
jgi:hypothetical protein